MYDLDRYDKIYFSRANINNKSNVLDHYTYYIHQKYNREIMSLPKTFSYLDLASGQAKYSEELILHFEKIIFSEISSSGLTFMRKKFKYKENILVKKLDIKKFNLKQKVDLISMASSLSYVEINLFLSNIKSNLSEQGYFIFLDTLNNNLIYRIYRNILRIINPNYRSRKVLKQLVNNKTLEIIKLNFKEVKYHYYGNSIMLIFLISKIFPIKIRGTKILFSFFKCLDRFLYFLPHYKVIGVCKYLNL